MDRAQKSCCGMSDFAADMEMKTQREFNNNKKNDNNDDDSNSPPRPHNADTGRDSQDVRPTDAAEGQCDAAKEKPEADTTSPVSSSSGGDGVGGGHSPPADPFKRPLTPAPRRRRSSSSSSQTSPPHGSPDTSPPSCSGTYVAAPGCDKVVRIVGKSFVQDGAVSAASSGGGLHHGGDGRCFSSFRIRSPFSHPTSETSWDPARDHVERCVPMFERGPRRALDPGPGQSVKTFSPGRSWAGSAAQHRGQTCRSTSGLSCYASERKDFAWYGSSLTPFVPDEPFPSEALRAFTSSAAATSTAPQVGGLGGVVRSAARPKVLGMVSPKKPAAMTRCEMKPPPPFTVYRRRSSSGLRASTAGQRSRPPARDGPAADKKKGGGGGGEGGGGYQTVVAGPFPAMGGKRGGVASKRKATEAFAGYTPPDSPKKASCF